MRIRETLSFSNRLEVSVAAKIALRPVIVVRAKTVTSIFKRLIPLGVNLVTVIQPAPSMETLSVTLQMASATARQMSEVSFIRFMYNSFCNLPGNVLDCDSKLFFFC